MILGTGVDLVEIERIEKWLDKPRLLNRVFHPDELDYAETKGRFKASALAARFAAKEAFGKALGTGLKGLALKDVRVQADDNGRPEIVIEGTAVNLMNKKGGGSIHLSLSHEGTLAIAQVIIEKRELPQDRGPG